MDNLREARLMLSVEFQKECAQEVAIAVCEYFRVDYVPVAKPAAVPKPKPEKQKSVQILTGGLSPESVKLVSQFFKSKKWWGQIQFSTDGKNPRALSGGLSPSMKVEYEAWLNKRDWHYEVIKK